MSDDDFYLRDVLRERLGLSEGMTEDVAMIVRDWLETYARAGVADVVEPVAELERK